MPHSLLLRLEHAFVPGRAPAAARAVAAIMTRPCFVPPLIRVALEKQTGRKLKVTKTSAEAIEAYMQDPQCDMVDMDSGRHGDLVAAAGIETGLVRGASAWEAFPAPLAPHIVLPHDPAQAEARLDAFCELAVVLQAMSGIVTMEVRFGQAFHLAGGSGAPSRKQIAEQPGMTERRLRERYTYSKRTLDRVIPAPEWGLFLGRKHLDVLSADALEQSGVFHRVRRLADDLVFLQLTADPADALREDYDEMLNPVRRVLAPLLADISDITLPPD